MNVNVLIDSIVRQVTVLIAQLATSGGVRAPLAHVANQVFLDLANELESQGVSRKVSADMFGMALRAYIRKVRRLSESESYQGGGAADGPPIDRHALRKRTRLVVRWRKRNHPFVAQWIEHDADIGRHNGGTLYPGGAAELPSFASSLQKSKVDMAAAQ